MTFTRSFGLDALLLSDIPLYLLGISLLSWRLLCEVITITFIGLYFRDRYARYDLLVTGEDFLEVIVQLTGLLCIKLVWCPLTPFWMLGWDIYHWFRNIYLWFLDWSRFFD